jgi:S-adenosylmethionine decarboxylase proenzyme
MVTKESSKNKELLGTHYMVDCKNVSFQRLNDSEAIKHMFDEIIASYDLKVVESGKVVHQFSPQGVTCVYTLSTSHLSIHTWPEKGKATLDLYTCNTISYYPERTLEKIVARYFNCPTEELKFRIIYREI